MLLAIDTATRLAGLSLYDPAGGRVLAEEAWHTPLTILGKSCRALFRRNGSPFSITSLSPEATGRQTDSPDAISGGMLMKLSIASPPLNPIARSAAKISSHAIVPAPGVPRSDSDRWI